MLKKARAINGLIGSRKAIHCAAGDNGLKAAGRFGGDESGKTALLCVAGSRPSARTRNLRELAAPWRGRDVDPVGTGN
jgi:hypothetical protein